MSLSSLHLCVAIALAALAVLAYMLSRFRSGRSELTVINALILSVVVAILGAAGIPLFEIASNEAKSSALMRDLHTLRSQIELYKLEHGDQPPLLYQGTLPQLTRATNVDGMPGEPGSKYPLGPYLRGGIPLNPFTGRAIVTATNIFPPKAPSGNGGWLYHQQTGRITADLEGYLTR